MANAAFRHAAFLVLTAFAMPAQVHANEQDMMNQLMNMRNQPAQPASTPTDDQSTQDYDPQSSDALAVTTAAPGFMQTSDAKTKAIVTGVAAGAGLAAVAGGIAIAIEETNIQKAVSEGKPVKPLFAWMAPKQTAEEASRSAEIASRESVAPAPAPPPPATPVPPSSPTLLAKVKAGGKTLSVKDQDTFKVGDYVVLGQGTSQQEMNQIMAFGSIILKNPLQFDHPSGTVIETISPPASTSTQPPTTTPSTTAHAKLGDEIPLPVWIALAVLACCCLGALICACVEAVRHSGRKKRTAKTKNRGLDENTSRSDSRRSIESSEYEDGSYYAEDSSPSYVPVAVAPLESVQDPMYSYSDSQYTYDPQGSYMTTSSQLSYADYAPTASYALTDASVLSQSYVPSLHENRYPNAQAYVNPADNLFYYNTNS